MSLFLVDEFDVVKEGEILRWEGFVLSINSAIMKDSVLCMRIENESDEIDGVRMNDGSDGMNEEIGSNEVVDVMNDQHANALSTIIDNSPDPFL